MTPVIAPDRSHLDALLAERGDPSAIPADVLETYRSGDVRGARRALFVQLRQETDEDRRALQERALRELRTWAEPADEPGLYELSGIGTRLRGSYQEAPDGSRVATLWLTLLFLPVFPIAAYVVSGDASDGLRFHGRVPLPMTARIMRGLVMAMVGFGGSWAGVSWLLGSGLFS